MFAGGFYLHDIGILDKPKILIQQGKPSKDKKDWIKINKCIATSQAILIEETSKAYMAKLKIDKWKQEVSKLNMDKTTGETNAKNKANF